MEVLLVSPPPLPNKNTSPDINKLFMLGKYMIALYSPYIYAPIGNLINKWMNAYLRNCNDNINEMLKSGIHQHTEGLLSQKSCISISQQRLALLSLFKHSEII